MYELVDDSVKGIGGTMLTLNAIVEPFSEQVNFTPTYDFSPRQAFSDKKMFIFGNIVNFSKNSLDSIFYVLDNLPFVKIEFDYGYCINRGRIPHRILSKEECNCPNSYLKEVYQKIRKNALHIFFMSDGQMKIHDEYLPEVPIENKSVLSSCFSESHMLLFNELKQKRKNKKYAIIDGNGGWHTEAKGIKESIKYAESNALDFDLIKTDNHLDMLHKLSEYKGLISMPIIEDTCPRITIEARYMGLEVVTNTNSQHITEYWWKDTDEKAFSFTESRPKYFWNKIKCLS